MTYRLLDSGDGRKLERVGPHVLDRQAPAAVWRKRLPKDAWAQAYGVHVRSERGGGHWKWRGHEPDPWTIDYGGSRLLVKPTPFGHLGLFAEQAEQWTWIDETVRRMADESGEPPRILNLFAYTGGSTLAAARAGAAVTHVDAARGVVDWARENAAANDLADRPVRWIVEDCVRYLQREARREARYDGLVLDPPTFGRGKRNEVWKIDDDLPELLELCAKLTPRPRLVLFSCHSPGYSPIVLENLLEDRFGRGDHEVVSGEMTVVETSEDGESAFRRLPSGTFTRWRV